MFTSHRIITNLFAFSVSTVELFRTGFALDYRISGFQVRWISNNSQTDVLIRHTVQTFNVGSKMVLDITRALKYKK